MKRGMYSIFSMLLFCFVISGISAQQRSAAAVFPESARPGTPLTIAVSAPSPDNLTAVITAMNGERIGAVSRFFTLSPDQSSIQVSITAVPSTAVPGAARIVVKNNSQEIASIPLTIEARSFVSEEIPLNESNTAIRTEPDPQKTRESEILWRILSATGKEIYSADTAFILPVESTRRTSFYGDRRVYLYSTGKKGYVDSRGRGFRHSHRNPRESLRKRENCTRRFQNCYRKFCRYRTSSRSLFSLLSLG